MAVYKVPQDVEAEDKLLGPFSFRQFIYLIIVVISGAIAWGLAQVSPFLIAVPLPIILLFGALALPLRKDQPMETYLAAMIQFLLKPKRRLWSPDGTLSMVKITAPRAVEDHRTKGISENEAINRLSYLAQIMDTRGWSSRGVDDPLANTSLSDAIALEAQETPDIMDDKAGVVQSFNTLIEQQDAARKQEMRTRMQEAATAPARRLPEIPNNPYDAFTAGDAPQAAGPQQQEPAQPAPVTLAVPSVQAAPDEPAPHFNPYPTIHQHVVQPLSAQAPAATPPPTPAKEEPGKEQLSPDIIKLANNPDLSISTIAHEAHRLQEKQSGEEVVISLR